MGNPLLFEGGEQERGSELCERRRGREVSVDGREARHTGHWLKIAVCRDKQDASHDVEKSLLGHICVSKFG